MNLTLLLHGVGNDVCVSAIDSQSCSDVNSHFAKMIAAGKPEDVRIRNDALIAFAEKHPDVLPIATVHPYDG